MAKGRVHDINGITENSLKRLKILKKFSTRGSSFNLASHDLDMRGSGNIIGGEQSGHVKEVGLELYHRLLKDKINELRTDNKNIDNVQITVSETIGVNERITYYNEYGAIRDMLQNHLLQLLLF